MATIPGLTVDSGNLPPGTTFGTSAQNPGYNLPGTSNTTDPTALLQQILAIGNQNTQNQPNSNQGDQFTNAVNQLSQSIASANTAPPKPLANVQVNWGDLNIPTISQFETQIATDPKYASLMQYYDNLLTQSKSDVTEATRRMNQDYTLGNRRITEDTGIKTTQTLQDLKSSLASLGITFTQEQNNLLDSLNKRGVALTQNTVGDKPQYAGGGQAGFQTSQLSQDQALRQEAVQRNADRTIQQLGITKQRTQEDLSNTAQNTQYDIQKQAATDTQNIAQQKQQGILQRAQLLQAEASQKANVALQKASLQAQGAQIPAGV